MWLTADEGVGWGGEEGGGSGGGWRDVMNVRQDKREWWCWVDGWVGSAASEKYEICIQM